tara:strand:+ start:30 stop:404 length:375 start_codon:yes stop_codon:yes gene_type:complete
VVVLLRHKIQHLQRILVEMVEEVEDIIIPPKVVLLKVKMISLQLPCMVKPTLVEAEEQEHSQTTEMVQLDLDMEVLVFLPLDLQMLIRQLQIIYNLDSPCLVAVVLVLDGSAAEAAVVDMLKNN